MDFNKNVMEAEPIKPKSHRFADLLHYEPNSTLSKVIFKKITGSIVVTSVDTGAQLKEQKIPFDTCIQIIEGIAEIVINNQHQTLESGEGIIIPAHSAYHFMTNHKKFKMIVTIIKSGYED